MAKPSSIPQTLIIPPSATSPDMPASSISRTEQFFRRLGDYSTIPAVATNRDAYSNLIRSLLKIERVERGSIICLLSLKAPVLNFYSTLHGGAVASVAVLVATACVRTIVVADKELFLGELAMSYLSAAGPNVELEVNGSVVRHGRNVTVTSVEFRNKQTNQLVYTARATFYNMPSSNL